MNRKQRRNFAKVIVKGQVNQKVRLRYSNKLEEFKQLSIEALEAMKDNKFSNTDRLALQDAIKFKTEENGNSGDSTTDNN